MRFRHRVDSSHKELGEVRDEADLAFKEYEFQPQLFPVLCDSGVIGMEMCDKQILDLFDGRPLCA